MATATIPKPTKSKRGTVTESLVSRYGEIYHPTDGFMAAYNVEREEEIQLLGTSLIAGLDPLLLGDPGVGKTWLIELLLRTLEGADSTDFFNTLVFKETPADDILGPRSLPAMKQGKIERLIPGFLPAALVAYLDEIFKASPTLTNSLLDVMAKRELKVGANILSCAQLLCIFFSSNELPDREDQQPMRNRIGLTKFVKPVRTPEGRRRVMDIQDEYQAEGGIDMKDAPKFTLDEVAQIRAEVQRIIVPDTLKETLDKAQERWGQEGFDPGQRRVGQMLRAIKARAWARGDGEANTDDILITQHMAWDHPDHAAKAREVVMEFANVFTRKAARMSEALEPVLKELGDVKKAINEAGSDKSAIDAQLEKGFEVIRSLRKLKREARAMIEEGKEQGHDVSDLDSVLDEIGQAHSWLEQTLTGDEDND